MGDAEFIGDWDVAPRGHPNDGRVVSNFIVQALRGEPLTLYGNGSQTRSFCYRDDLVEGIIRMMNGPNTFVGPVNLGNPDEFTIRELAELVIELTQSSLFDRSFQRVTGQVVCAGQTKSCVRFYTVHCRVYCPNLPNQL